MNRSLFFRLFQPWTSLICILAESMPSYFELIFEKSQAGPDPDRFIFLDET